MIVASPLHIPSSSSSRKTDSKRDRDRKAKKSARHDRDERRDSLIEAWPAPQPAVKVEKEAFCQLCEMCNHYFQHPVTYHMRMAHPGCRGPAGGKGYNSGGNYCGGWAGNCGDGGMGGSIWYLMCEKCRENNIKRIPAGQPPQQPQQKASAGVDQNGSPAPVRGAPVTPARASSRHLDQQQSSKLQQQLQQAEMKTRKKSLTVNIYFFIILKCC